MDYLLMKKDLPVAVLRFAQRQIMLREILNAEKMPYLMKIPQTGEYDIMHWLDRRMLAKSRASLSKILTFYEVPTRMHLLFKNKGLSLTDTYWLKREDDSSTWGEVNFFENDYGDKIGDFIINNTLAEPALSPDLTTNGVMEKSWRKKDGQDFLFKFGRPPFYQEAFNEVLCSQIARAFPALRAVPYYLGKNGEQSCSLCPNFITQDIEFVPASDVYSRAYDPLGNSRTYLAEFAKLNHITEYKEFINQLLVFDYLIGNSDRNLGNIGFMRDAESCQFISMAPVFDNGNSLWFDEPTDRINGIEDPSKPFATPHEEQIKLTHHIHGLNMQLLYTSVPMVYEVMAEQYDKKRAEKITEMMKVRIQSVEERQKQRRHSRDREK